MVYWFSQMITRAFDLLVAPFGGAHAAAALSALSAATGVLLIFVFKAASDQERIRETRDRFKGRILEMRIFQDDIVLIARGLFAALGTNATYLRVSLKPIVVLLAVVFLIFVQLDERYGRRALRPGETALVTVGLNPGVDAVTSGVRLEPSAGLSLDAPPVRVPSLGQISWRLRADSLGAHEARLVAYGKSYAFPVTVGGANACVGRDRTSDAWLNPLLHPSLPSIPPETPFASVEIRYPQDAYAIPFLGRHHWLVVFIVWSFVGALVPKFVFRIEV